MQAGDMKCIEVCVYVPNIIGIEKGLLKLLYK